jgi:Uncharacterised protein conserved in bacteria (DUF2336)
MHNILSSLQNSECAAIPPSLIDELNDAISTGGIKKRLEVLERITDLFASGSRGYSSDQIALFDDVLHQLVADVEVKVRARLAERLAHIDASPPGIIRSLAFDDEIAVAGPVLMHSQQLCDADLVENATTKSQEHLLAIAQRLELSDAVTDILVERGDRRVVHKVVQNKGAHISPNGYQKLTTRARRDSRLTSALSRRNDLPRQYFLKLLETASAAVRDKLESDSPEASAAIRSTVDDVATAMQQEVREASHRHAVVVRDAMRRFNVRPFTEANIHAPAENQEFVRTTIVLSKLASFPVDLVERALLDKGEDMILILAKAAGCSWTTARKLLLMHIAERKLQPSDLDRSFSRYSKLTKEAACSVVAFYRRRLTQRLQHEHEDSEAEAALA